MNVKENVAESFVKTFSSIESLQKVSFKSKFMNSPNDSLFSALVKCNFEELTLGKVKLDNASVFATSFLENKSLKKLVIQNSCFSEAAGNALATFVGSSTTLKSLFISNTELKGESPSSLATAFEHSHVDVFNLNAVKLGVVTTRLFAMSLNNNKFVKSFTLYNCSIDGDGAGNKVTDSGAIELCKAIKDRQKNLRVFDISGNVINQDNKKIIFEMLPGMFKGGDICPIILNQDKPDDARKSELNKIALFYAATCKPNTQNLYCALPDFITFKNMK